jgi:hypothetical protein
VIWFIGFGLVVLVMYAGSCWWFPYAACGRCEGVGKFRREDSKVWRKCRRCRGSGERLRVGRRVWNYWHHRRQEAR